MQLYIIEDNTFYTDELLVGLNQHGDIEAMTATSIEKGLKDLERFAADALLLDINLPGMNGIKGIKKIRKIRPNIKIIILTILNDKKLVKEAIQEGADGFIHKNSSIENIIEALHDSLKGEKILDATSSKSLFQALKTKMTAAKITPQERALLSYLAEGLTSKEVAVQMGLSVNTINNYTKNVMNKMGCKNKTECVAKALKDNLI